MSVVKKEGKLPPLRDRAMAYLARRDHTPLELARKLQHAGYEEDDIQTVLDELSQRGWLSSHRFAENYVTQKLERFGGQKLAYELRQKGVEESVVQQVLEETKDTELERAREVWRKKFGKPPADQKEKARQIRFLQSRGFSAETISRAMHRDTSTE
ncbi:MAG: recombination regulator RecX [Hydrogenophilaceae bacterium]|nr:recombination regulator RecX [Hydrogenophilaceae bacterium]